MNGLNPVERAFELAREGECKDLPELERRLKREGYSAVSQHLAGRSIRSQINQLLRHASAKAAPNYVVAE